MRTTTEQRSITVGSVMHAGVITCRPETTLRTVAAMLAAHNIHAVVVAGPEEKDPRGVVSDRDVIYAYAEGRLDALMASDAASQPTVTVRPDLDLRQVAGLMARYGTSHVVVTKRGNGKPVGILSSLDIADAVTSS